MSLSDLGRGPCGPTIRRSYAPAETPSSNRYGIADGIADHARRQRSDGAARRAEDTDPLASEYGCVVLETQSRPC